MARYKYRFEIRDLRSLGSVPYRLPINCWRAQLYLNGMQDGVLVDGQELDTSLEVDPVNLVHNTIRIVLGGIREADGTPVMIDQQLSVTNGNLAVPSLLYGVLVTEYLEAE